MYVITKKVTNNMSRMTCDRGKIAMFIIGLYILILGNYM